ncbi:MAG: DUF2277 domain-containing protein [Gemmatimonadaceae bacterium]
MCRNIRTLYNFEPHTSHAEMHDAALQFIRKVSGMNKPSKANEAAFNRAVEEVRESIHTLFHSLETKAPPRNREEEIAKLRAKSALRFPKTA